MLRLKNILVTIVLNAFLMLLASVMMEYNNLAERFSLMEDNIHVAMDMSVDASTASEELFSASYQEYMTSAGLIDGTKHNLGATVTLYRQGQWFQADSYALAYFYDVNKRLPNSSNEYYSFVRSKGLDRSGTVKIYEWLFGQAGESYTDGDLSWANKSITTMESLGNTGIDSSSRKPTEKFKEFYDAIGYRIESVGTVKSNTGEGFSIEQGYVYPSLANMGLELADENRTSSNKMSDNFCMSFHAGKAQGGRSSVYFLTPNSLGVTYVPIEVAKPIFIANLDTLARLQKLASGNASGSQVAETLNSADECLSPDVWVDGQSHQQHIRSAVSDRHIVTDGNVEYDLDSVQFKVDYFVADFYSTQYRNIAARVEGSITGADTESQFNVLGKLGNALYQTDSYRYKDRINSGNRIVAKVTVRLKCYITYQSSVLQWLCYTDYTNSGASGEMHYCVKEVNPLTGKISRRDNPNSYGGQWQYGDDGVWYQYSTYIAMSR